MQIFGMRQYNCVSQIYIGWRKVGVLTEDWYKETLTDGQVCYSYTYTDDGSNGVGQSLDSYTAPPHNLHLAPNLQK